MFWQRCRFESPRPAPAGRGTGRGVPKKCLLSPTLSSTSLWRRGRNTSCTKSEMRAGGTQARFCASPLAERIPPLLLFIAPLLLLLCVNRPLKKTACRRRRRKESQISSETRPKSETRYLVSYFFNGLLKVFLCLISFPFAPAGTLLTQRRKGTKHLKVLRPDRPLSVKASHLLPKSRHPNSVAWAASIAVPGRCQQRGPFHCWNLASHVDP